MRIHKAFFNLLKRVSIVKVVKIVYNYKNIIKNYNYIIYYVIFILYFILYYKYIKIIMFAHKREK